MVTLRETIAQGLSSSVLESEDRWRLCYDTHVKQFHIEHVMGIRELALQQTSAVLKKYDVSSWDGPGAAGIPEAKARLLARADS